MPWQEVDDLREVASDVDVLYMTRIQKERFKDMQVWAAKGGGGGRSLCQFSSAYTCKREGNTALVHPTQEHTYSWLTSQRAFAHGASSGCLCGM